MIFGFLWSPFKRAVHKWRRMDYPSSCNVRFSAQVVPSKEGTRIGEGVYIGEHAVIKPKKFFSIGDHSYIGDHCILGGIDSIEIGHDTVLTSYVKVYNDDHPLIGKKRGFVGKHAPVKIGNYCFVGAGTCIAKGVTLGDNVTVGMGAVVINSFPPNCVVAGNPATVIRRLDGSERKVTYVGDVPVKTKAAKK